MKKKKKNLPAPIKWTGGKSKLAPEIKKIIDQVDHNDYIEPFVGGGNVYFEKDPSPIEILSDLYPPLMRFYGQIKKGQMDLSSCNTYPNRDRFNKAKQKLETQQATVCDFLVVNKNSFGGNMKNYSGSLITLQRCSQAKDPSKCGISNFTGSIDHYSQRMKKTRLFNKDYQKIVQQTDAKDALFYVDPPYQDQENYYPASNNNVSPEKIAEVFNPKSLQGKAIISFNKSPRIQKIFSKTKGFYQIPVKVQYSMNADSSLNKKHGKQELIITTFPSGCFWNDTQKQINCKRKKRD